MKKWILLCLVSALPFVAFAQDEEPAVDEEPTINREPSAISDGTPLTQKARYRLYPGGQDEQDLQVQTSLPQPQRTHESIVTPVLRSSGEE